MDLFLKLYADILDEMSESKPEKEEEVCEYCDDYVKNCMSKMLGKMKARRIDMFFMRYYDEYCSNKVVFNELDSQKKSFKDYVKENKDFLVKEYIHYRRSNR